MPTAVFDNYPDGPTVDRQEGKLTGNGTPRHNTRARWPFIILIDMIHRFCTGVGSYKMISPAALNRTQAAVLGENDNG
jgi:hypothetical protein